MKKSDSKVNAEQSELWASPPVPDFVLKCHFRALLSFTQFAVKNARELAQAGQKDFARDWSRFFFNSHIVDLLRLSHCCEPAELSELTDEMRLLGRVCHPEFVPSFSTDLAAIRASLENIISLLEEKRNPSFGFFGAVASASSHLISRTYNKSVFGDS